MSYKKTLPSHYALPSIAISILLVAIVVSAWQDPPSAPPGGNAPAPLNVSTTTQYKSGALTLGSIGGVALETYSNTYLATLSGNVGIGTFSPSSTLHVVNGNDGALKIGTNLGTSAQLCLNNQCFGKTDLLAAGGGGGWISTGTYFKNGGTYAFCSKQTIVSKGVSLPISINDGGACGTGSSCYNGECLSGIHNFGPFNDPFEDASLSESWASTVVGGNPNAAGTISAANHHSGAQSLLVNTSGGGLRSIPAVLLGSKCSLGFWMYDGGQNARSEVWAGLYNSVTGNIIFALSPRYDISQTFWTYTYYAGGGNGYVNTPFARTKNAWSSVTIIYDGTTGIQYTINGGAMQSVTLPSAYGVDSIVSAIGMGGNTEYIDDIAFSCTP